MGAENAGISPRRRTKKRGPKRYLNRLINDRDVIIGLNVPGI
jgi:hypothetical protein